MTEKQLTKELLESLEFDVTELVPGVFYIRNFVTEEELNTLWAEINASKEDDWTRRYLAEMERHALDKFGTDDLSYLKNEGLIEVTDDFFDKTLEVQSEKMRRVLEERSRKIFYALGDYVVTGFQTFQRLYEGSQLKAHYDRYSDKLVAYASVLYLNDDYNGGELFFPELDFEIAKPEVGSLIIFPGSEKYTHGVRHVKEGPVRYVIPAFIKIQHPDGDMAGWGDFG